jgi:hypothetical protein
MLCYIDAIFQRNKRELCMTEHKICSNITSDKSLTLVLCLALVQTMPRSLYARVSSDIRWLADD